MFERIQQACSTYRFYSTSWGRMPWRIRAAVGLIGTFSGWVAYMVMTALTPASSSARLDSGLPVLSITVVLAVNLVGQFACAWWWTARRTGLGRGGRR